MYRIYLTLTTILTTFSSLLAQSGVEPPADFLRSVGKFYVVVAVIVIVFLGLVFYLWSLDRRVGAIENQIDDNV